MISADEEHRLAVFNWLTVFDENLKDLERLFGLDFIHHLHRLNDAKRCVGGDMISNLAEYFCVW